MSDQHTSEQDAGCYDHGIRDCPICLKDDGEAVKRKHGELFDWLEHKPDRAADR